MQPSSSVQVMFVGGTPSGIDLPASVILEVTDTEPGVKGDTVSNVTKPATLETGAIIQVPLFVNVGDKIKLDPREKSLHPTCLSPPAGGLRFGSEITVGSQAMPRLVDTTIRVLSQEPLAGLMPTADLLRLAELLDGAGFAYLEVSGGGVFDNAVRRGVESPWERIRALKARTTTPLALALRGRFLVGSRPVGGDFARRFVASAAQSGIEVFRLHDPLNDVDNLREAAEAIVDSGAEFEAGLLYGSGRHEALVDAAKRLPQLGAARILLNDPAAVLQPHRASELVAELRDVSGLPVGLYAQGAGGNALAAAIEAARAGADVIATSVYPVALTMHRVSSEAAAQALAGLGLATGVDMDALWAAADLVDEHIGDEPVAPVAPRIAVRAAQRKLPVGLVARARRAAAQRRPRATGSTRCSRRSTRCASRSARRRSPRRSATSSRRRRS